MGICHFVRVQTVRARVTTLYAVQSESVQVITLYAEQSYFDGR